MSGRQFNFVSHIFQEYGTALHRFLVHRVGAQEADDVVQETYLHLLQYAHTDRVENPKAFLFKTASNLVIDRARQLQSRSHYIHEESDIEKVSSFMPDPETVTHGVLQLERFRAVLSELPPLCRHAFLLHRIDGMTHSNIAKRLGISKKTVERYIIRAFDHCYRRLGEPSNDV